MPGRGETRLARRHNRTSAIPQFGGGSYRTSWNRLGREDVSTPKSPVLHGQKRRRQTLEDQHMLRRRHLFPQPPPRQEQIHCITLREVDFRRQDTHIDNPIVHSPLPNRRLVDCRLGREVQVESILRCVEDNRPVRTKNGMVVEYERDQLLRVFRIYYQGNIVTPLFPVCSAVLHCVEEMFGFLGGTN